MKTRYFLMLFASLFLASCTTVKNNTVDLSRYQGKDKYERYILAYYPVAVEQMHKYDVPASITLAQGLLESGAGTSTLATEANNHFGIKADNSWNGKYTKSMDNGKMCKFRVYRSAAESYEDHSKFLRDKSRYASLFRLKKTDYKGWAKGLRKAGYAEDKKYPEKLISLIERYSLQDFDHYSKSSLKKSGYMTASSGRRVYRINNVPYIIVKEGDCVETISKEFGMSKSNLRNYNDLGRKGEPADNGKFFLKQKKGKAEKGSDSHTVQNGESLHSISQFYGVRLKDLLRLNPQYKGSARLKVGDVIRLR